MLIWNKCSVHIFQASSGIGIHLPLELSIEEWERKDTWNSFLQADNGHFSARPKIIVHLQAFSRPGSWGILSISISQNLSRFWFIYFHSGLCNRNHEQISFGDIIFKPTWVLYSLEIHWDSRVFYLAALRYFMLSWGENTHSLVERTCVFYNVASQLGLPLPLTLQISMVTLGDGGAIGGSNQFFESRLEQSLLQIRNIPFRLYRE